jgi:hypothetical protein
MEEKKENSMWGREIQNINVNDENKQSESE